MKSILYYALSLLAAVLGLVLTYKYLNQPGVGLLNWGTVGVMLVGAYYAFKKAEQSAN